LHFLLKQLVEAKGVYEKVLSNKPVVWAKLGLGKTLIGMGKLDAAEEVLKEVVTEDERYVEAHDMLSDIYQQKKDYISAQNAVEVATHVSPKSTLRHRKLAKLAEHNNNDDVALKSYQQSIKWGFNSVHESEQDYFDYARKVANVTAGNNTTDAKTMTKQANTALDRVRKRFASRDEVGVQAQMVETQLHLAAGDESKAQASLSKSRQMYADLAAPPVEASLELARTLHAADDEKAAREILTNLAVRHENNPEIMQVIDSITSEPISAAGKSAATKLTKEGISSYEGKDFGQAISVFNEALASYPNHIGLNLNLIQAVCAATDQQGFSDKNQALVKRSLRVVGSLSEDHNQRKRYDFLHKQVEKYFPALL
jgi:tetratricopeptide (TPR) repeat protein